jgi:hypothetical protein
MRFDELILDVEPNPDGLDYITPDGRKMLDARITVSPDGEEMLRQGYMCGNCFEDLRPVGAFPEKCPVCNFPVRELQAQQYERQHVGEVVMGSRLRLSDELEKMKDHLWLPPGAAS